MGEIADQGLSVRAMFHPIVEVGRDRAGLRGTTGTQRRESLIQVILEPVGSRITWISDSRRCVPVVPRNPARSRPTSTIGWNMARTERPWSAISPMTVSYTHLR